MRVFVVSAPKRSDALTTKGRMDVAQRELRLVEVAFEH